MNCNTTHYRANSSSVPGDPTESPLAVNERGCYVTLFGQIATPWYGLGMFGPLAIQANGAAVYTGVVEGSSTARAILISGLSCP